MRRMIATNSLGISADPLTHTCTECGTTSRTHVQRFQSNNLDRRICPGCHRSHNPRQAALADALDVIVTVAGGADNYDDLAYDTVSRLLSAVRAAASERHLDQAAANILGVQPGQKTVVDLGRSNLDGDGLFGVSAELRDGTPRIALGDGGYPAWEDDIEAARTMVQKITDMIAVAEMAAGQAGTTG